MCQSTQECIEQLKKIIEFRKTHTAPVDTMGSDSLADKGDPKTQRFQTLIALLLGVQTKDQMTALAMWNLKKIDGGLTASTLSNADPTVVYECIKAVRYPKHKIPFLFNAAQVCHTKYNDDIPQTFEELTAMNGVGTKIATLTMNLCWGKDIGIGVDIHVHRISNLLGWVHTENADETEIALERLFPKEYWPHICKALAGFGQAYCTKKKPKCFMCPIRKTCLTFNADEYSDVI